MDMSALVKLSSCPASRGVEDGVPATEKRNELSRDDVRVLLIPVEREFSTSSTSSDLGARRDRPTDMYASDNSHHGDS